MSVGRGRNTEDVVHVDNAVFLSHKKRNEVGSFGGVPATHSSIPAWEIPWTEQPESYSPWWGGGGDHTESDTTEAT